MRCGLSVPIFGEYSDVRRLAELAAEAEAAGWDGYFTWDHLVYPYARGMPDIADATIVLAAVALATTRMRFGPMVTPLPRRRPAKVAREILTLDHLSGGRVVLGVGIGSSREEFADLGDTAELKTRAAMLDEALEVVTGLWAQQPYNFAGEHYTVHEATFLPRPVQPRIPIWVAGTWPRPGPLARALRWDGYVPLKPGLAPITASDAAEIAKAVGLADRPDFDLLITEYGTGGASPAQAQEVGASWWIRSTKPWTESFADFRRVVRSGPVRG